MTVRELIAYRREAEQYLGTDDHLYRVHWVRILLHFFHLGRRCSISCYFWLPSRRTGVPVILATDPPHVPCGRE